MTKGGEAGSQAMVVFASTRGAARVLGLRNRTRRGGVPGMLQATDKPSVSLRTQVPPEGREGVAKGRTTCATAADPL